jgi:hypothetical protein
MNRFGTALALLGEMHERGLKCWPEGSQLIVYPRCYLTDDLAARIREYKQELLLLAAKMPNDPETTALLEAEDRPRSQRRPAAICGYVPLGKPRESC